MNIKNIFGQDGPFAQKLPDYEYRPQQIMAAEAIHKALLAKRHCLVEAGTGVGKSMAYLIPAIDYIAASRKLLVATYTIYLQSQLLNKDIPFLQQIFPQNNFKAALVKGRSNYLCLNNYTELYGQLDLRQELNLDKLARWVRETETGDIAEMDFKFAGWNDICSDQDTCHRQTCKFYDKCFYYRMRDIAEKSDIIITNHSLFFTDLSLKMENPSAGVLPAYNAVVFDEAHHLEDVATNAFSMEFNSFLVPSLIRRVKRIKGIDLDEERLKAIESTNENLLKVFFGAPKQEFFIRDICFGELNEYVDEAATELRTLIDGLSNELAKHSLNADQEFKDKIDGIRKMCTRISDCINAIFLEPEVGHFRWGERKREDRHAECYLRSSPLNVSGILSEQLWPNVDSAILTSATLADLGGFTYIKSRLGITNCNELIVDSPFDFSKQCLLYVPHHLDFPNDSDDYASRVASEMEQIVTASGGGAFMLFTSYRMMNEVYNRLAFRLPYVQLKQGDLPNEELIREFLRHKNACLYGVSSFWEGVDIKGSALSCVIIDKLPFASPDNPINKARMDALKEAGENAFVKYSIPQAQIKLKQGFGRLIRTKNDRGVVAILDSRLLKKQYGKAFLRFLPHCPLTSNIDDVRAFFRSTRKFKYEDGLISQANL